MRKIFTEGNIGKIYARSLEEGVCTASELIYFHSSQFVSELRVCYEDLPSRSFIIFCGPGYNGSMGLNIALILAEQLKLKQQVEVYLFKPPTGIPKESIELKERLLTVESILLHEIDNQFTPPQIEQHHIVIDALFGTGLSSPLRANSGFGKLIKYINSIDNKEVVSVDIPSGLSADSNEDAQPDCIIRANHTFCLDFPKLSSFFAENREFYGNLRLLDFKLSNKVEEKLTTHYCETTDHDIEFSLQRREQHTSSQETQGKALIIGGGSGIGALALSSKGALTSGISHLAVQTTSKEELLLQVSVPEVISHPSFPFEEEQDRVNRVEETFVQKHISLLHSYAVIALGRGLWSSDITLQYIEKIFFSLSEKQFVFDENAVEMFIHREELLEIIPSNSILILSPSALDRLVKVTSNKEEQRMEQAKSFAKRKQIYIILRGYRTAICLPNGTVIFDTSGSCDKNIQGGEAVLLGMVTSLLTQNYSPGTASMIATHLYGLACDLYIGRYAHFSLTASAVLEALPSVFKQIK